MLIPSALLRKLYTNGSLRNTASGAQFALKNRLMDVELTAVGNLLIDRQPVPIEAIQLQMGDRVVGAAEIDAAHPIPFPLLSSVTVQAHTPELPPGAHDIDISFETRTFGRIHFDVEDSIGENGRAEAHGRVPRSDADDYTPGIIGERRTLIENTTGVRLRHITHHSFEPSAVRGNCENFVGVAQVPIGLAGPLRINGEHAQGDFLIPLATSEGTLVASHNRGMKVLNLCGGVKTTVVADSMQRAPVFVFDDARSGRAFVRWMEEHLPEIRREAESTSSIARLQHIDPYLANKFVYLRFNYSTGDAAGQNMVGRATMAACDWILNNHPGIRAFYLESNFATDKKASHVNIMRTRGKRVTAEATASREVLRKYLRVEPEKLAYHYGVANVGALLSGANNNGLQSANGIAAMFIATGQDVANVAESSAGVLYCEMTPEGGLYLSLTIPSLIVATYGGGTGLATQRECLEILGCYGKGKVNRLAEIVAAVTLAGEVSLGAAISSSDWVSSHEKFGRNR